MPAYLEHSGMHLGRANMPAHLEHGRMHLGRHTSRRQPDCQVGAGELVQQAQQLLCSTQAQWYGSIADLLRLLFVL